LVPSQVSGVSQIPAFGRQTAELLASAGHGALDPVQWSTTSQMPPDGRHTVAADL
jgi:hypothetical protein